MRNLYCFRSQFGPKCISASSVPIPALYSLGRDHLVFISAKAKTSGEKGKRNSKAKFNSGHFYVGFDRVADVLAGLSRRGRAGVHALASWQDSARYALVVMFVFTATAHFNKMKHDLARMIPALFPHPLLLVYVTGVFAGHDSVGASHATASQEFRTNSAVAPLQRNMEIVRRHEVEFYPDDAAIVVGFTRFIEAALKVGTTVVVVAAESHRESLLLELQEHGVDIAAAIEQGLCVSLDVAETLATFMVNDLPDPEQFLRVAGDLVTEAAKAAKGESPRVAANLARHNARNLDCGDSRMGALRVLPVTNAEKRMVLTVAESWRSNQSLVMPHDGGAS